MGRRVLIGKIKMIKFLRGNPESLEGRATIYSKFSNLSNKPNDARNLVGLYITSNPEDLANDPQVEPRAVEAFKIKIEKIKEQYGPSNSEQDVWIFPKMIFCMPPFEDEQQAFIRPGDVIFTGSYIDIQMSIKSNQLCQELYINQHNNSLILERKMQRKEEVEKKQEYSERNYQEVEKRQLKAYLMKRFVDPLIVAKTSNNGIMNRQIRSELSDFCDGSLFTNDIIEILKIIDCGKIVDHELIGAYLDRAQATNSENYELAGSITQIIKTYRR